MNLTVRTIVAFIGVALIAILLLVHFPFIGIAGFAALGALIASGTKWGQDRKQTLILSEHLSPEGRLLLRPVRRLAAFNREVVRKYDTHFGAADEALIETDNVVRQCIRWLEVRDRLSEMLAGRRASQIQLAHLRWRLQTAMSEVERKTLEEAISEQSVEVAQYEKIQRQIEIIDARLCHAQFALEHLKTVLTMNAFETKASDENLVTLGMGGSGIAAG